MFDVITIGGATRDVFFSTKEGKIIKDRKSLSGKLLAFEYGAKIVPEDAYFSYGGGGMNAAVSFAKLGLKVAAKINIGSEGTGSLINRILEKKGVDISLISRDKKLHTALSIIVTDKGDHTMFLYRGSNDSLKPNLNGLKDTRWMYISSLTGKSEEILEKVPNFISSSGIRLAWNPGSVQISKGIKELAPVLKITEILVLNKAEAKNLLLGKLTKKEYNNEKLLAEKLAGFGPKIIAITDGERGSFVYDGTKHYYQKSLSKKVVESTGAGDSFGSTFVGGIILGYDIKNSMKIASLNAASVISQMGAQEGLLTLKELQS